MSLTVIVNREGERWQATGLPEGCAKPDLLIDQEGTIYLLVRGLAQEEHRPIRDPGLKRIAEMLRLDVDSYSLFVGKLREPLTRAVDVSRQDLPRSGYNCHFEINGEHNDFHLLSEDPKIKNTLGYMGLVFKGRETVHITDFVKGI